MTYTMDIRPRRQATFPNAILVALGLSVGDSVQVEVRDNKAILTPKKRIALDALLEIQKAFKASKIKESDFLNEIDKQRLEVAKTYSEN